MTWKTLELKNTDTELAEYGLEFLESISAATWRDGKARVTIHKRDMSVAISALSDLAQRLRSKP